MTNIIDFRAKVKSYHKKMKQEDSGEMGKIILFSGVRFERFETTDIDLKLSENSQFVKNKSR